MATIEQHLRVLAGDLVLRIAALQSENDALLEELAKRPLPGAPPPSAPEMPGQLVPKPPKPGASKKAMNA
jgi:hypothetical protein